MSERRALMPGIFLDRRRLLLALPAGVAALATACANGPATRLDERVPQATQRELLAALARRLPASGTLLLGEVHDNEKGHAARLVVLQQLAQQRVPTVLALEHLDRSRQGAFDVARAAAPRDPQRWIDAVLQAGNTAQWPWELLRPALELAAMSGWPVRGVNLTRAELAGSAQTPDAELGEVGLQRLRTAIESGHCGVLPPAAVVRLVAMQQARDRAMVQALVDARGTAARVILLAGNGHVRRDFGVAAYSGLHAAGRVVSVGFLELGDGPAHDAFDHVVEVTPQPRPDPCAALRDRKAG
jgi:uncharacterized iron-regulated protein